MTLAIAGVTGFIGRHLLRRCHDSSIDTVLLVRPSQVNSPFGHGVDVVDLSEATQLLRGRSAHEDSCLVHLIGASRDSAQASVWQSNVDTTRALIEIAEAAGLRRIVYLSGYGVTHDSSDVYFRSKAAAERLLIASSVPATIFRCSYLIGDGDELTPAIRRGVRKGSVAIVGSGSYRIQPLLVDDVVSVIVAAASETSRKDILLDLIGEAISFRDFVELFTLEQQQPLMIHHIPIEDVVRQSVREFDPPLTLHELAVLVCDLVGAPTQTCYGVHLRGPREIVDCVLRGLDGEARDS